MQHTEATMVNLTLRRPKKELYLFNYRDFARFSLALVSRFCRWYADVSQNATK